MLAKLALLPCTPLLNRDVMAYVASKGLRKVSQVGGPAGGVEHVAGPVGGVEQIAIPSAPRPAAGQPDSGYTDFPVTSMRATIARRLLESKTTIPHIYTGSDMTVDRLFALQKSVNKTNAASIKVSINDLALKACAYALRVSLIRINRC